MKRLLILTTMVALFIFAFAPSVLAQEPSDDGSAAADQYGASNPPGDGSPGGSQPPGGGSGEAPGPGQVIRTTIPHEGLPHTGGYPLVGIGFLSLAFIGIGASIFWQGVRRG